MELEYQYNRPGKLAMDKLGVRSPLQEVGLTKEGIRVLSHKMGLPTCNIDPAITV